MARLASSTEPMTSVSDKRGDKAGEAVRVLLAKLRHRVIGDARQREPGPGGGEILDRRIGQRDHLAVIAELVHLAKPRLEIVDLGHAAQPRGDIAELRRRLVHFLEEAVRIDMAVKIDERPVAHGASPLTHHPHRLAVEKAADVFDHAGEIAPGSSARRRSRDAA